MLSSPHSGWALRGSGKHVSRHAVNQRSFRVQKVLFLSIVVELVCCHFHSKRATTRRPLHHKISTSSPPLFFSPLSCFFQMCVWVMMIRVRVTDERSHISPKKLDMMRSYQRSVQGVRLRRAASLYGACHGVSPLPPQL